MQRAWLILLAMALVVVALLAWPPAAPSARRPLHAAGGNPSSATMGEPGKASSRAAPAVVEIAEESPTGAPPERPAGPGTPPAFEAGQAVSLPAFDLAYFEARLDDSPRVAAAEAERESQERDAARIDCENGLKAVAGATAGRVTDPFRTTYNSATVYGGLSYPILGSRAREQADLESAKSRAHSLKGRAELARREDLRELRRSYVQYWVAARQTEAARAFLSTEAAVRKLLERRSGAGMLRESRRLDLLTAFDVARSDLAAFAATRALALMTINRIAGTALQEFDPAPPALPADWPDQGAVLQRVAGHPELEALRALLANRHDLLTYSAHHYPESDLLLSLVGANDSPGGLGGGATLGIEFRMPIGVLGARREGMAAARLSLIQYQRELEYRTQVLQGQAVESFALVEAKGAGLSLAQRRLAAAEQALREDFTRAKTVPQDSLEALLQSRRDYYRAAMDCLAAELDGLTTRAALLALTGDPEPMPDARRVPEPNRDSARVKPRLLGGDLLAALGEESTPAAAKEKADALFAAPRPAAAAAPAAPSTAPEGIAVYMWATQQWLNRTRQLDENGKRLPSSRDYERDPIWRELARYKVHTLLLSLDARQIAELAGDAQAFTHLVRLLGAAHERECRVELLLGEPTWIRREHRQELLDIIQKLRSVPFDGLHLDLEPNQLNAEEAEQSELLGELVETLRAVKDASPWEVTLTLPARSLDAPLGRETLGSALEKAGVRRVAAMIYFSDTARIRETAGWLLDAHPGLRLSVAVSVESAALVSEQVTLAGQGRKKFFDSVWELDDALRRHTNYGGLEVQDWASLREMKP